MNEGALVLFNLLNLEREQYKTFIKLMFMI